MNQPLPGDGQAMRRYCELFHYDVVGNILQLRHTAIGGDWTRHYTYEEPHAPAANNRLNSTRIGEFTEHYKYDANAKHDRDGP